METGTLNELVNTRSVIKHIRKHNKAMEQGAGIGNDFSIADGIAVSEGVASSPYIAWVKAMNNLAVSGAKASGVRIVMLLPGSVEESDIKFYMKEFNELADNEKIQILGGHTEVGKAYNYASFVVTVYGSFDEAEIKFKQDIKAIDNGCEIIMLGYAGLMGTDLIARHKKDELRKRFADSYINGAFFDKKDYAIKDKVSKLLEAFGEDVLYMHDVSHGGVYGALWQLGVKIKQGISINHAAIPIKQETVEISEFFDINPYLLEGTGAVLAVLRTSSDEEDVFDRHLRKLENDWVTAALVGRVTEYNNRIVLLGNPDEPEERFLSPIKGDEIYKALDLF